MTLRILSLSALTALGFAGAASAAGYEGTPIEPQPMTPAPMAVADSTWTGFYLGGQAGRTSVGLPFDNFDDQLGLEDDDLDGLSLEADGNSFGLHAGYLHDFGQIVAGGELEYARTDLENDALLDNTDIDAFRAKGRLGYDAGSFLPYITVGASRVTVENDDIDLDEDDTLFAYGIGADYQMANGFRIGVEYLREQTDDYDYGGGDDAPEIEVETDTLSLRASYAF